MIYVFAGFGAMISEMWCLLFSFVLIRSFHSRDDFDGICVDVQEGEYWKGLDLYRLARICLRSYF